MSGTRAEIMTRLKAACPHADDGIVRDRLSRHPRNLVPRRAMPVGDDANALFVDMARQAAASVSELKSRDEIPAAAAAFLRQHDLPEKLRLAADARLAGLDWGGLETIGGPAGADDTAALSHAFCGIAETGTLMMLSGPDNPVSLNFLPDNHLVVLEAGGIVGAYEDAWDRLREKMGESAMPRAVNWITGPSRTADIEQTLVLGAHGPRRLHILLIREQDA